MRGRPPAAAAPCDVAMALAVRGAPEPHPHPHPNPHPHPHPHPHPNQVIPAYLPAVAKHKDDDFTQKQKEWQQMRRGTVRARG